jgi:hypothetical protein
MKAQIASDGAVRWGLNQVGLKKLPDNIAFQVGGTTSMPIFTPDLSDTTKQTLKDKAKDGVIQGFHQIFGQNEDKPAPAAPKAHEANQVSAKSNEALPAPAATPKKHRSILNPFGWGKQKNKDEAAALTAKK